MTDEPETTDSEEIRNLPEAEDPIERMPPQLREANRRRKAGKSVASMPSTADNNAPPAWFTAWLETSQQQRSTQFVEHEPEPGAEPRVADAEELTDWQLRVRDRVEPAPKKVTHGLNYNYPYKWYMKHDGTVVELQGDPQNFLYYTTKKKFHALTDGEVREFLKDERPKLIRLQRQKAQLIDAIRENVALDPMLKVTLNPAWDLDLDHMTIPELQDQMAWIKNQPTADGRPRRVHERLQRFQDADTRRDEAETKRMLDGVETTSEGMTQEAFHEKMSRGRSIEVTPDNARTFA